jgi:hypothetical protein
VAEVSTRLQWGERETLALIAQGALAMLAYAARTRTILFIALALLAGVSVIAWWVARRRVQAVDGTPTSKVASAAQGYVELCGRAEQFGDTPTVSPYTGLPCVWYRYRVERREANNRWVHVDGQCSDRCFRLVDDTGACVIDPAGAEVLTTRAETRVRDGYRYTEQLLLAQDRLYALGEFSSGSNATLEQDARAATGALLAEWKADRPQLLARFDANHDGTIDLAEWELARAEASREALAQRTGIAVRLGPHRVGKPQDGRPFILSNLQPEALARRWARLAWLHFAIGLGAVAAIGWAASQL